MCVVYTSLTFAYYLTVSALSVNEDPVMFKT
jgi:hypothetical protein